VRGPSLVVLLAYAEAANVYVDALIKDSEDLPQELPSRKKHEGGERTAQEQAQALTALNTCTKISHHSSTQREKGSSTFPFKFLCLPN
jgi:hypothetical protein